MTRLSSSQQINQNTVNAAASRTTGGGSTATATTHSSGNIIQSSATSTTAASSANYVTPVPPLSSNVIITGHNKWGIPSTKITSGGVTVTTSLAPRVRPYSQGPTTLMGSTGALGTGKLSGSALNQSTGSIGLQQVASTLQPAATTLLHQALQSQPQSHQSPLHLNSISVHHASPASPTFQTNQKSVMTLPVNSSASVSQSASSSGNNHEVIVSGPMTVTSRRNNDNTSVTLLNANSSIINQRMSTFEPYQIMRDTVQQFCEKHFSSIKVYMDKLSHRLPPPTRCGIEGIDFDLEEYYAIILKRFFNRKANKKGS